MTTQFNVRVPQYTTDQIEDLAFELGLTKTQMVILAIDRLHATHFPNDHWMVDFSDHERELLNMAPRDQDEPDLMNS